VTEAPLPSWHVGVVGAGAAGLAVARALMRAGYRRVTVLEREPRVGGKCCTFRDGGRSYELGAGALTPAYVHVRALLEEHDLRPSLGSIAAYVHDGARSLARLRRPIGARSGARLAIEGARLAATLLAHPQIRRPGLAAMREGRGLHDLHEPFAAWAAQRGLTEIARTVEPWFTGFGYGYLDEVPAAYVLKYASLAGPVREILDVGYQGLWERVARTIDVRLGVTIRAIERRDRVVVRTDDATFRFDALVVACPIEAAAPILDASDDERALFAQVTYNDYHVVGAVVRGLPDARFVFFADHLGRRSIGRPMFWYRRWKDRDLVLFYALAGPGDPLESTVARVADDVERLGGSFERVRVAKHWRYFPHVGPEAMRRGFFDRFEALQGERRTYYAGETLSFGAVEPVVAYAEQLVHRFFVAA